MITNPHLRLHEVILKRLKEIPIYVKDDMNVELDHKRVALIENCHRKDMVGSERAHGFFEVYKMAGYTKQQVISGVKAIDNWFSNKKGPERDWNELRKSFTLNSKMIPDEQFIEICKDIGFAPKYQYQLINYFNCDSTKFNNRFLS